MRSIALAAFLLGLLLLIVLFLLGLKKQKITDYYDNELRYENILKMEKQTDELVPFASEISVVDEQTNTTDLNFDAGAGLLADYSNTSIAFASNPYERMNPASTTKIMTALVALKYGNTDDLVVVDPRAMDYEEGSSVAGIKSGQTLSLKQLLYGLMLPSGNDCANAIAIHIAGDIQSFVELMNFEAQRIGAVDTRFANAHGITDENHYTTAYDLYLITRAALEYDDFRTICRTKTYVAEYFDSDGLAISKTWENTNKYVNGDEALPGNLKLIGGKTGTTMAAGNCLVLAAEDESENDYISIVLKASGKDDLYENMNVLLEKTN